MKRGVMYKGCFWPVWGGGNHNKSPRFSSGGIEDLSVAILAGNHYASVCVEVDTDEAEDICDRADMEERGQRPSVP